MGDFLFLVRFIIKVEKDSMNGNLETRVSTLETQMQDVRDLLQQLAQSQARAQQQLDQTSATLGEVSATLSEVSATLSEASAIAKSNARSIQAWEARIEENKVEAEEELSRQAVRLRDLQEANRENVLQHMEFRQRFDETLAEIRQIWTRLEPS